ncbi:MAG: nucleotide sugar dehydrogenase [Gammaproteobacteria bacterium]
MKISIFGLGYVGAVSLACLARDGHEVVGVDIDPTKLDLIRNGKSPVIEEGIQEVMADVVASGRVSVTDQARDAVRDTELSFVCVGTPSMPNGSQDLRAMRRLAEEMGKALKEKDSFHTVMIRSTIEPGTITETVEPILVEHSGKVSGEDFGLGFQPEFLREGTSIKDYDNPPMTVVGANSDRSIKQLEDLFGDLPNKFLTTDIGTAECLKYACNAYHAVKVTFANEIGRVTQSVGVDSRKVMELVCEDHSLNISKAYLRPGFAFGGSCLPKDLRALLYVARSRDVDLPMMAGLIPSNVEHIDHALSTILGRGTRKVGFLGLSFKSGTDDLRESPLLTLAEQLIGKGMELKIYDPEVNVARLIGANRSYLEESIPHVSSLMCDSAKDVIDHADVIVVGLSDAEIIDELHAHCDPRHYVLDLVSMRDADQLKGEYRGVCW